MDDSNSPPPIPDRPGRVIQIHGIDSIKSESTPNEYVDTNTIPGAHQAPQRPPKLYKPDTSNTLKAKVNHIKDIEQQENITNELREHWHVRRRETNPTVSDSKSPKIPPRSDKPPPVPPRDSRVMGSKRLQDRLVTTHSSADQSTRKCNSSSSRLHSNPMPTTNNISTLPATVLIITEESRFPQFPTRSLRRDKAPKDSITTSQPVTQQPLASNVTLTLGETGNVNNSIICQECGQCRCADCSGNRKLPEHWLCEGNCRCSADSVVDTLSCMWCAKMCFKTIIDNPEGPRMHPCACTKSPKCLLRWTALAALSLCLPCLCCYCPMQLGVKAATACYNCRKRGCNCERD